MLVDSQRVKFSQDLLEWFSEYGRHDLPWQQHKTTDPDPYKVWLSEVMLQQTQVKTVIPYFERFIRSFPTVKDLANADWDDVAEHWAGLGYYARARNLHKGAKQLIEIIDMTGDFPQSTDEWERISGVGRSTAGAIVAMGLHKYGVICDGNVKRVLTRWAGIDGDITKSATTKQLWNLAESLTPKQDSGYFAQAMMDMGATVCIRNKPACITKDQKCPIQSNCIAFSEGQQLNYPVKIKKKPKPSKYSLALSIINPQGKSLIIQRPDTGIWGGLWCFPLKFIHKIEGKKILPISTDDAYEKEFNIAEQIIDQMINDKIEKDFNLGNSAIKHTLTHFHWFLQLHLVELTASQSDLLEQQLSEAFVNFQWLKAEEIPNRLALPKAMIKLLE